MRTFTDKDRAALSRAFRHFVQLYTGVREPVKAIAPIVDDALEYGLTVDMMFNRENYSRAGAVKPNPTAREYIDILLADAITVREIKEEPYWMDMPEGDLEILAECYHEFYVDICAKGGRYSSANAWQNFMRAIDRTSLQALCSSELIAEVAGVRDWETDRGITIYQFIEKVANDLKTYHPDTSLTREQEQRRSDLGSRPALEAVGADSDSIPEEPWDILGNFGDDMDMQEQASIMPRDPRSYKREVLWNIILRISPKELARFSEVVGTEGEPVMSLEDMVNKMTDGKVMAEMEDGLQRETHSFINGELSGPFISSILSQGFDMNSELASRYDFLMDNWDLRDPKTRKLHKLKDLILTHGSDDMDLIEAIPELEELFSSER